MSAEAALIRMRRTTLSWLVVGALVFGGLAFFVAQPRKAEVAPPIARATANSHKPPALPPLPADAVITDTTHYRIRTTATAAQTKQVARAVESLYRRYADEFAVPAGKAERLSLVLYRDRAEFKRNNRSRPWAEAYYLSPRSYAYFDANARNPYHWMLHEATHQLMREVSRFPRAKWVDEGVASYFGSSRLVDGALRLGDADPEAYPIWWLSRQTLTGNLEQDIAAGRIIPLEQLVSGQGGPDENRYFNLYYIHYWSLTHFLLHYREGLYADRYKRLIAEGGTLQNFTRIVGPPQRIQREWYAYLRQIVEAEARLAADGEQVL